MFYFFQKKKKKKPLNEKDKLMQEVPGDWEQQGTVSLQQSLPRGNSSQTGGGGVQLAQLPKKCFPSRRGGVE